MLGLSGGQAGSFANASASIGNSLSNLFAPGSDNIGPTTPIMDPFAGQLHSRFEVPDTAGTVNLGDLVVFMMMSDGEDFYTRDICPIVEWNWAIKRINYGTWVFPQYAVRPTPETAPPRNVEFYEFNDTTTLTRYATGHHMSVEYMNTARGQDNQRYNLKQLSLNIQETQNICIINALMKCRQRMAERREIFGSYTVMDLEEEFKKEVSRFCRVQKEEYGFLTMWEEIQREMARLGGRADSVIITKRVNTLVVTRPEYTKYMEAGPSGPATVRDSNRTFLPAGVNAYFSNTYPERFGSNMGPWQQLMQIGTYVQSRELSILMSKSDAYFKNYDSKTRSVWIYDMNVDKFVEVDLKKMIENCGLFENNGSLRLPSVGRSFSSGVNGGTGLIRDFLTMDEKDLYSGDHWKRNPYSQVQLSDTPLNGGQSSILTTQNSVYDKVNSSMNKNRSAISKVRSDGVRPINLIGHLQEEHFGVSNFQDCGYMMLHRIADLNGCSAQKLVSSIQQGLALFADMSRRQIDYDFIDYVIRNAIITMYRSEREIQPDSNLKTSSHVQEIYVDTKANTHDELWKYIRETCLQDATADIAGKKTANNDKLRMLKNVFEHNLCLPLPTLENDGNDKFGNKSFPNLTGYQSFPGFCEMAKVFKSSSQIAHLVKRYNMKELEIASNFVDALEMFAQGLETILPECVLFNSERDGSSARSMSATKKARVIAEKVFNIGGSNIWCNLKKHSLFLVDAATALLWKPDATKTKTHLGGLTDDEFLDLTQSTQLGEFYQEVTWKAVASYYGTLLETVPKAISLFTGNIGDKDWKECIAEFNNNSTFAKDLFKSDLTPDKLSDLVRGWIFPKLFMKNGSSTKVNTSGLTIVDGISKKTRLVGITTESLIGMLAGVSTNASQLCCGNSWMGENCILLSGPLRLAIFEAALQAVLCGYTVFSAGEPVRFMNLLFDINCIMAPYDTNILDGLTQITGYAAENTFVNYMELFHVDREKYLKQLKIAFPKTDLNTKMAAKTLGDEGLGMLIYKDLILELYEKYFGKTKSMVKNIAQLKKSLNDAAVKDAEYATKLTDISGVDSAVSVPLPILRNLSNNGEYPEFGLTNGKGTTAAKFLKEVVVKVAPILGVRAAYADNNRGDADDILIGAKGKREHKARQQKVSAFYADEKKALSYDDKLSSFFKTSLVFSAEQMEHLLSTNMAVTMGNAVEHLKHIDLRPTNPGDYSKFVSRNKSKEFTRLLVKANNEEASGAYNENPDSQPHWREVPLLHVGKKLSYTIFGAPHGSGWHNSGGCGLPVDILNKSFARSCFTLDRTKCPSAVKMLTLCYMSTGMTASTLLSLAAANVRVPMNFILARPHRNLVTESCAILSTGIDKLGFTVMACRDYVTGQTVLTKEWQGHVSFMTNAVITHPENCYIQPNLMVTGYGTGQGLKFFTHPEHYGPGMQCGEQLPNPNFPSMFCFAVPFTEVVDKNYICTPGQVPHLAEATQSTQIKAPEEMRRERHYSTARRYNERWNFNTMVDSRLMQMLGSNPNTMLYNTQCYQDTCQYWDPYHKEIRYMSLGTGHLGHNQGPGFKSVMEGKVVRFKDYGYEINPSITIV